MNISQNFRNSILVLLFIFSIACNTVNTGKKNTPAEVSERFFSLLKNQEYEKAKALGTEQTVKIIGVIQTLSELGGGINIMQDNKKELLGCETTGNEAVCTYKTFLGSDQKVYLVKQKGKWLVDLRKENTTKKPTNN